MSSSHETVLCQYRYDALDRLIECSPQQAPQHQRFYCKSRLATEIQGAIQHSIIQHGDLLLAQQHCEGNERNAHLLATDQQRSVLHILNVNPQPKPIAYSPYGHRHPENGWLGLLGFNGERPDPVTGHYLLGNGYRAFNPVLMRFNSPDSWSPFGDGGFNAYAYCAGDPINKSDPGGHKFYKLIHAFDLTNHTSTFHYGQLFATNKAVKTPIHAKNAADQINKMTEYLKSTGKSATLISDFKLRKSFSIFESPTLHLEALTRKKIYSSGLSMNEIPPKLHNHQSGRAFPDHQHNMSPSQLSDQINLMEYIHGSPASSKHDWNIRLNEAAEHQTHLMKNGTEVPLNMELAKRYREKLNGIRKGSDRLKLKKTRDEIFKSHFYIDYYYS